MGWAARAKEQKGNPQPAKRTEASRLDGVSPHRIRQRLFDKGKTRGLVTFAGLVYAVDRHGTMRRTPMTQAQLAEQTQ